MNGGDITRRKPAILVRRSFAAAEQVFATDPWAAGQQVTKRNAIVWQISAICINYFDIRSE